MRHENKRWQQVFGGVFIALSLILIAAPFGDFVMHWAKFKQSQAKPDQAQTNPSLAKASAPKFPAEEVTVRLLSGPAVALFFVGITWFWNARKQVGVWAYRILTVYFVALTVLIVVGWFTARNDQSAKSSNQLAFIIPASLFLGLAVLFFWRAGKLSAQNKKLESTADSAGLLTPKMDPPVTIRPKQSFLSSKQRSHSCNVLHVGPESRQLWQFDARSGGFEVNKAHAVATGEPLPYALVTKTWRSLWQRKLNIAWLPAESVFLRVAHLPKSSFEETRAMVELQLEKLSPIPVTQVVWSLHVMPQGPGNLQTVVVVLAERKVVEEFLGQLEGQGYLADSLELPVLDQLRATAVREDAVWIYPAAGGQTNSALVAWWCGGALQNINLIAFPENGDRVASLKAQLGQIVWAGELEGWLTGNPAWHLVADDAIAAEWEAALRQALDTTIQLSAPLRPVELAALTARRATDVAAQANLLPKEYEKRYQQQFIDRLWLRGLGAVVGLYVAGVIIYGLALLVLSLQTQSVEKQVVSRSNEYTNAMQLEARSEVLKDRQALKFAALDCWRAVADAMPGELTLDGLGFSDGHKLTVNGNAPAGQDKAILDFNDQLRKTKIGDQLLFDPKKAEPPRYAAGPGGVLGWNFSLELLRAEAP